MHLRRGTSGPRSPLTLERRKKRTAALFIVPTEHRDIPAIYAKFDEPLRVHGEAERELMGLDQEDVEEIAADRANPCGVPPFLGARFQAVDQL